MSNFLKEITATDISKIYVELDSYLIKNDFIGLDKRISEICLSDASFEIQLSVLRYLAKDRTMFPSYEQNLKIVIEKLDKHNLDKSILLYGII